MAAKPFLQGPGVIARSGYEVERDIDSVDQEFLPQIIEILKDRVARLVQLQAAAPSWVKGHVLVLGPRLSGAALFDKIDLVFAERPARPKMDAVQIRTPVDNKLGDGVDRIISVRRYIVFCGQVDLSSRPQGPLAPAVFSL